jgi:hypothetical protein
MSAVLVYDSRVEVPDGWIVVSAGPCVVGDQVHCDGEWWDLREDDAGVTVRRFAVVIRPDRPATGATK